jgi:5-(carboxyamino)imidazole ribonucleotide synthase
MKHNWYGESAKIGVLGGGQLGRMLLQAAIDWNVHLQFLDPDPQAPCAKIGHSFTCGSLQDFNTIYQFGRNKDFLTVEIENVNIEALEQLEQEGVKVFPQSRVLKIIRDKGTQKEFYAKHGFPTSPFRLVEKKEDWISDVHFPIVQKLRTGGYDGRGVQVLHQSADLDLAFDAPSVLEEKIPFIQELSVIVARNEKGQTAVFPTVACDFNPQANLVELLYAPANISEETEKEAQTLALKVIETLEMVGLLAVEMFLDKDGKLYINEMAPRPHNSGHHTIECNVTSQYQQHLRAILGLPLGATTIIQAGAMINLLGEPNTDGIAHYEGLEDTLSLEGVYPHIYGKEKVKSFRKMGHVTVTGSDISEVMKKVETVKSIIRVVSK